MLPSCPLSFHLYFCFKAGEGGSRLRSRGGAGGGSFPSLPFLFPAAARTPALCGRDGPVAVVPGTTLVAAAAPWQPRGARPGSGAPPLSPPRRAPPAAPLPRELRGVLSGKGNGSGAPPSVRERLRDRFLGAESPSSPSSARCVRGEGEGAPSACKGWARALRWERAPVCRGILSPCACVGPRCRSGVRRGDCCMRRSPPRYRSAGFRLVPRFGTRRDQGAHPDGLPAAPGARCVRGAAGEERPRGESGGAERGRGELGRRGREAAELAAERRRERCRGRAAAPLGVSAGGDGAAEGLCLCRRSKWL